MKTDKRISVIASFSNGYVGTVSSAFRWSLAELATVQNITLVIQPQLPVSATRGSSGIAKPVQCCPVVNGQPSKKPYTALWLHWKQHFVQYFGNNNLWK